MAARTKTSTRKRAERQAATRPAPKLTDAQRQVAEAYLADPARCKVRAYLKAHPTCTYDAARTEAVRTLAKPHVLAYLREREAEIAQRLGLTPERVLGELAAIAFANAADFFEWDENGVRLKSHEDLPAEFKAAVAEVSETTTLHGGAVKLKLRDKIKALELLGKNLGLFQDKVEVRPGGGWVDILNAVHEHATEPDRN